MHAINYKLYVVVVIKYTENITTMIQKDPYRIGCLYQRVKISSVHV